ncbi:hypothetical protein CYMTET_8103 [Cymbomonas tetramitiformis]|uniref:Uncharacterized protein n=1 Tax=Cymbomonas tetramitiformis TaxID=36881 RepID=A0AAE0FJR5_9CHLO|nr:hypothetical protein CYMTET_30735 [Cymbomonas tetramitiformis]KAK3284238.1 hypothetical protein CYMTET_8103 [Cymbomonas tetramitiformis]
MRNPEPTTPVNEPAPGTAADMPSPQKRKGSLAYWKAKAEMYKAIAEEWEMFETSPVMRGLLTPETLPPLPPKPSKGRLTDYHGSFSFNDIRGKKRARKEATEQAGAEAEARRVAASQRAADRDAERDARETERSATRARLEAEWESCGTVCSCLARYAVFVAGTRVVCPMKGMKKCLFCTEIKKSVCGKAACKRQRLAAVQ